MVGYLTEEGRRPDGGGSDVYGVALLSGHPVRVHSQQSLDAFQELLSAEGRHAKASHGAVQPGHVHVRPEQTHPARAVLVCLHPFEALAGPGGRSSQIKS